MGPTMAKNIKKAIMTISVRQLRCLLFIPTVIASKSNLFFMNTSLRLNHQIYYVNCKLVDLNKNDKVTS